MDNHESITAEDVLKWQPHCIFYLIDILNGKYPLHKAREDILSFRDEIKPIA